MEYIGVFDMLKIGVGPSSSHTLGPWRAAEKFVAKLAKKGKLEKIVRLRVDLYGSLSLTGKGHATDIAIMLGLSQADPERVPIEEIQPTVDHIAQKKAIRLSKDTDTEIPFDPDKDIIFHRKFLDFHPNGMTFVAIIDELGKGNEKGSEKGSEFSETYFSIGGGFIVQEGEAQDDSAARSLESMPYPYSDAASLGKFCHLEKKKISDIVRSNEEALRKPQQVTKELHRIWDTMLECIYIGCHTEGYLPGGLNVRRRAYDVHSKLMEQASESPQPSPDNVQHWFQQIQTFKTNFRETLNWVNCFALSVNEVNAALGRVVTAPTNGSAGVIPAVLMYYLAIANSRTIKEDVERFLLVAGAIGSIFKRSATISAAMGGCQAEIGVSSAMAAGALTEVMGGSVDRCLMAAEIAMEHHLGLTCDPIQGLVQIPCIERNSMGTIKAINASELALVSNPSNAKVSLDTIVKTMWETAQDMNTKYKETSEGGLAVNVSLADC